MQRQKTWPYEAQGRIEAKYPGESSADIHCHMKKKTWPTNRTAATSRPSPSSEKLALGAATPFPFHEPSTVLPAESSSLQQPPSAITTEDSVHESTAVRRGNLTVCRREVRSK
ncbi:rhomboid-related intramembrane serine proteasefamily protein [Striga asiatica]|uniref:Rhomboid-related intramembrane serine proteasefamily protein n=1 Tax=Striga asiatica TaxID=4170 RepID=A0A5A7QY19_STRAF|nr:rhomboid-related intramembrane serine proteasefamily protein [Striga asiatica]